MRIYPLIILTLLLVLPSIGARKLTIGFEIGNTAARGVPSPDGFTLQVSGGGFNTNTQARSGTYSRILQLQNSNLQQDLVTVIPVTGGWYLRAYIHGDELDRTPSQFIPIVTIVETGASNQVGVGLTATRRLALNVNGAYTDSSTSAITNAGGWYLCELYSTWLASGNTHTLTINNSQTLTNNANLAGLVSPTVTYWQGNFTANTVTMNVYLDDIGFNDASGSYENTFPDDTAHVVFMPVVKDTSIGDWLAGAGASTNLYEALNNVPPVGIIAGSETDGTSIKNTTSSATSNYDGATLSYNTFGIPPTNGLRVIVPVTRHGEHAAAGTISGALKLVSNPPDTAEMSFTYGSDVGAHGNDNVTGTMKWYTTYGTPVYGAFADQHVDRNLRPVVRVGKRTATTAQSCVDLLGLIVEHGTPYARLRRHKF